MLLSDPRGEPPEGVRLLKSHSLTMLVQRELERMILGGEIAVGEKLNEIAIAARLGVSRGPVRESFRALEETGLVRIEKNRGVFVREISVDEADDIYEIRAAFDQMAGRKLALSITAEQLAHLRALVDAMEDATRSKDLERYHPLNLRFHDRLKRDRRLIELAQPAIDHAEALAIAQIVRFAHQCLLVSHPRVTPLLSAAIEIAKPPEQPGLVITLCAGTF